MTLSEYNATRVLPERKRATRNGKRSIDAFVKSIRDRIAAESPEWLDGFDNDLAKKLSLLYFYFTKYIAARWNIHGMVIAMACSDGKNIWYSDNLLDDNELAKIERVLYKAILKERINELDKAPGPCYDGAGV